jgi:hypothetical protein
MKIHKQLTPNNWCKKATALTDEGYSTNSLDPRARKWCALGWIEKLETGQEQLRARNLLRHELQKGQDIPELIQEWNDRSTFADVKAMFEKLDL